jgi:hypothetical protein
VRCVIGTLPLALQTNALIEEPLVRVPGGLSATLKLSSVPLFGLSTQAIGPTFFKHTFPPRVNSNGVFRRIRLQGTRHSNRTFLIDPQAKTLASLSARISLPMSANSACSRRSCVALRHAVRCKIWFALQANATSRFGSSFALIESNGRVPLFPRMRGKRRRSSGKICLVLGMAKLLRSLSMCLVTMVSSHAEDRRLVTFRMAERCVHNQRTLYCSLTFEINSPA